ncbi:hypothetical protein TELCIR_11444 [Teladorsagia circumcincta]|uniref:Uncharacterized protein n=1 Tax=Teladorsagia circumcincta TaxID=45464 RepID=A0A2G9U9E1_TELCI|nr:hypothetical protein TELCIR_11444 [Teladorsagia circumcincta]
MPMTGDEPWAQHLFSSKEDQIKYKLVITNSMKMVDEFAIDNGTFLSGVSWTFVESELMIPQSESGI